MFGGNPCSKQIQIYRLGLAPCCSLHYQYQVHILAKFVKNKHIDFDSNTTDVVLRIHIYHYKSQALLQCFLGLCNCFKGFTVSQVSPSPVVLELQFLNQKKKTLIYGKFTTQFFYFFIFLFQYGTSHSNKVTYNSSFFPSSFFPLNE